MVARRGGREETFFVLTLLEAAGWRPPRKCEDAGKWSLGEVRWGEEEVGKVVGARGCGVGKNKRERTKPSPPWEQREQRSLLHQLSREGSCRQIAFHRRELHLQRYLPPRERRQLQRRD